MPLSAAAKDVVEAKLKVQQPNLFGELPDPPGEVELHRYPIDDNGECTSDLVLPDGNSVRITSKHQENKPVQLCGVTSDLTREAEKILRRDEQIPRVGHPVPAQALARVDACGLLQSAELRDALGTQVPPYPELGGWGCSWDTGEREITVEYYREPPLDPADHGRRVDVGGREFYVKTPSPDNWPDACSARIVHRRYQDSPAMVESLRVYMQEKADPETLCAVAEKLGRAVVGRLP